MLFAVVHEDGRVLRTYDIDFGDLDRERPAVCFKARETRREIGSLPF